MKNVWVWVISVVLAIVVSVVCIVFFGKSADNSGNNDNGGDNTNNSGSGDSIEGPLVDAPMNGGWEIVN